MNRPREIATGDRALFAVKLAFMRDPDQGRGISPDESASWGSFEIWVNGQNLCSHQEQSEPVSSVHWYLLPMLEWFVANWDFLLHEERLPAKNAGRDAWSSMLATAEPPPGIGENDAEAWEVLWQNWWSRHCLLAARKGGLFPRVFFRRWQDLIEISWGDSFIAGAPDHFRFDASRGFARLAPDEIASVLFDVILRAVSHLQERSPESARLSQLIADVQRLASSDNRRRLGLLAGINPEAMKPEDGWVAIESLFPAPLPAAIREAIFSTKADDLVVRGSCQASLMFGSVSPMLDSHDKHLLASKLVALFSVEGDGQRLRELSREEPIEGIEERAWKQGYRLAESLLEVLNGNLSDGSWVDVERIFSDFDILIEEIALHDSSIRAVAIAGPLHRPTVLMNRNFAFNLGEARRFTLAHELCHILYDRGYGARLALASGPWAPIDIERRANAFAAMLLMPRELVAAAIRSLNVTPTSENAIWGVARRLKTSFVSTLEHLCNLGFIDETTRDSLAERSQPIAATQSMP